MRAIDATTKKDRDLEVDTSTGALNVIQVGGVDTTPQAAGGVGQIHATVNSTQAALTGTSARGFLLFNNSSGGQTIYFGDTGLSTSTGFPLRAGDGIDRPTWQDLSVVFALASADGADLRAVPL